MVLIRYRNLFKVSITERNLQEVLNLHRDKKSYQIDENR